MWLNTTLGKESTGQNLINMLLICSAMLLHTGVLESTRETWVLILQVRLRVVGTLGFDPTSVFKSIEKTGV